MSRLDREPPEYIPQHNLATPAVDPARDPGADPEALVERSYHQRQRRYRRAVRQLTEMRGDDARLQRRAREAQKTPFGSGSEGSRRSGVSDPTARVALQRRVVDPAERAIAAIDAAIDAIAAAHRYRARALQMKAAEGVLAEFTEEELEDACPSHSRAGFFAPRGDPKDVGKDSLLCHWCRKFERIYGQWPAREVLRTLDRKGRVTQQEIERSLRPSQPQIPPE